MLDETEIFTTQDFDYLRLGERALKLRFYRPAGPGPFPVVLDLHGGAWNNGDLTSCEARDKGMAEVGFAMAAVDFRQAADRYPSSLLDINYAVRWVKAHAAELDIDPGRVAVAGQSSGGHLAMLAAMRPNDERYASVGLDAGAPEVDASVRCVGMLWPVINPLSRYRNALRGRASASPPSWIGDIPESHDRYWVTDANMTEGNPMLALERGETLELPPAIWVQSKPDLVHDYLDPESGGDLKEPERFAKNYRDAGGECDLVYIDKAERTTAGSWTPLVEFFRKNL